jgi:Glycosyltransferase family 87
MPVQPRWLADRAEPTGSTGTAAASTTTRGWSRLAGVALVMASCIGLVWRVWDESFAKRVDFRGYYGTVAKWPSRSLYHFDLHHHLGFTYPPFAAIVLWPIAHLPETVAEHAWLIATVACSAAFLALVCAHLPCPPRVRWFKPVVVAVGVWSVPVVFTARIGQINAFLVLAVAVDALVVSRRSKAGGVLTGIAAAIKLTPLVAVLFFLVTRRWRAAITSVVTFVACAAIAWPASPGDSRAYWTKQLFDTSHIGRLASTNNDSVRRLITDLVSSPRVQTLVWVAACAVLGLVCMVRARRAAKLGNTLAALTLVMCLADAASPISWAHHLYFLLPALVLVIGTGRKPLRLVSAAALAWTLFETTTPGQHPVTNVARAIALILVIVVLPIDEPRTKADLDLTDAGAGAGADDDDQPLVSVDAAGPGWREWVTLGAIAGVFATVVLVTVSPAQATSTHPAVLRTAASTRWSCNEGVTKVGSVTWVNDSERLDHVHLPMDGHVRVVSRRAAVFTAPGTTLDLNPARPCHAH